MKNYLTIYRPLNILFIALAQWLTAYFLNFDATYQSVFQGGIYWFILGTAACAAFGYWINDFFDIERDAINKPLKNSVGRLNPNLVYVHLLAFISVALYCGNLLGMWFLLLFVVTLLVLFLYSKWLKNVAGVGNLLIATLSFVSVYAVSVLFPLVDFLLILHFAVIAGFVLSWEMTLNEAVPTTMPTFSVTSKNENQEAEFEVFSGINLAYVDRESDWTPPMANPMQQARR